MVETDREAENVKNDGYMACVWFMSWDCRLIISCLLKDEFMAAHLATFISISSFSFHIFETSLYRLLNEVWLLCCESQRVVARNRHSNPSLAAYE